MVSAFYLFLSVFLQGYCNTSDISKHLTLSYECKIDTISLNEEFELSVIFTNTTDSNVVFYPNALLSLVRITGGFESESYYLNETMDYREQYEIVAKGNLTLTFNIKIEPPTFRRGNNYFQVYYLCKKTNWNNSPKELLSGYLLSKEFLIYVN